jgi:Ca2+-binding EF-hand superfamily protein
VEVLQKVAEDRLPVSGLATGDVAHDVQIPYTAPQATDKLAFTLSMSPLDAEGKGGIDAIARHSVALDGKQYLLDKQVFPLIQGLVLDLLLERPEDPTEHLLKRLQAQATGAGGMQAAMSLLEEAKNWREQYTEASGRLEVAEALKASAENKAAELLVALENARAREEELTRELAAAGIDVPPPSSPIASLVDGPSSLGDGPSGPVPPLSPMSGISGAFAARTDRGMSVVIQTMREHKKEVEGLQEMHALDDWVQNVISSAEFEAVAQDRFELCDATKRGALTVEEIAPVLEEITAGLPFEMRKQHVNEFLDLFDMDQNGMISRDEFLNFAKVIFVHVALGQKKKKEHSKENASQSANVAT